ncbi:hypothetical protein GCM10022216_01910 [Sphingobacterium kyonggiense]|uniref:DUF4998 domain-containing protein n=1 Tax=Sphingobacterium kyonggiense TaxID=714075 RepID=A0ABP7Y6W4_9SPHI
MKNTLKLIGLVALSLQIACSKTADYTKYLESGEIQYAAKPEKLKAYPGNERIKLQWFILSDQNITKAKVYWRNKSDSLEVPITRSAGIDTISVIIPLAEGSYSFDVVHLHADGVKSLAANTSSNSYGPSYISTLLNRGVNSHSFTPTNQGIVINWGPVEGTALGTKVNYININNDARQFVAAPTVNSSSYTRLLQNSTLEYRTMYKPDTLSIDTFYSPINYIPIKY